MVLYMPLFEIDTGKPQINQGGVSIFTCLRNYPLSQSDYPSNFEPESGKA